MKTQIQKWGNSLAVRIPKAFANHLGLDQDSTIELALEDGCLVLKPTALPKYELSRLLSKVTEDNRHGEYDFGGPTGAEQW
jgi:antitoxin MazE